MRAAHYRMLVSWLISGGIALHLGQFLVREHDWGGSGRVVKG